MLGYLYCVNSLLPRVSCRLHELLKLMKICEDLLLDEYISPLSVLEQLDPALGDNGTMKSGSEEVVQVVRCVCVILCICM